MKRIIVPFVLAVVVMGIAGCGDSASSTVCSDVSVEYDGSTPDLKGCTLRVAVENAYMPFNFIDTDTGEGVGYDYDLFNDLCERVNCTPDYVETSWDTMIAVMAGNTSVEGFSLFDVGANGITITEERAQNVDFSQPYANITQVLLVRLDEDRFSSAEEFVANEDLVIATQLGTTNYNTAADLVDASRILAQDQFGTAVQSVISGDADAVVIDNVAGFGYQGENADQLRIIDDALSSSSDDLGFIFSRGSLLVDVVDWALDEMEADGTLDSITETWQQAQ